MCSDSSDAVDLMKSGLFFHEYVGCMITESGGQENRRGSVVLKWCYLQIDLTDLLRRLSLS
ncbi:Uncharacterised protein [Kluyvera ascorbata]|nr:Uncharacterised protein [Kluyvera ascorbata]